MHAVGRVVARVRQPWYRPPIEDRVGVWLLGSVEVGRATERSSVPGAKLQALVAVLALSAPHPVASDRLIDEIWVEQHPANPANALQAQISQLRRVLGTEMVARRAPGYVLVVEPDDVDAFRMERLVRDGREAASRGDQHGAAERYRAALSLVRGHPLAGLMDHPFAREAAARLTELVLAAHEGLADAQLNTGRHAEVVASLVDLVGAHPLRERFRAQLILALYRCGRQAEALREYQDARAVLVEELGVDPGPELQALERAVLAHDPALASPMVVESAAAEPASQGARGRVRTSEGAHDDIVVGLPLVGRDSELRALHHDLEEVLAGRGRVVLLGGEPGIGKSRLAEELVADATARGATAVWGRCYEGRGAPAFWPWTQVVGGLLAAFEDDELRAALGAGAADLAQIVPEVKELAVELSPLSMLDPESARFRLYQAVSHLVRRLARVRPLVVVLDDLHWADESSLALLGFLASEIAGDRVLAIGTYRTVEPAVEGPLAGVLVDLARRSVVRRVDLAGLDREGLARLLTAAGTEPHDELLAAVQRRTQGNPYFLTELLRLLPEGDLHDASSIGTVVPAGVKGVIRQRLARLPDVTGQRIAAAAVVGQEFDLGVLATMVEIDGAALLEDLEPAVRAGILSAGAAGGYRFSHGLVNETVYADLGAGQRARTHRRAAEAIESRYGRSDGPHLLAVAAHWFRAVPAAPHDAAVESAVRAAQWAQAHVAHDQAEAQLRAALELLTTMPEGRQRAALELAVQYQLSVLLIMSARGGEPRFEATLARLAELCDAVDDHASLVPALWLLSVYSSFWSTLDRAVTVGERLLAVAEPDDAPGPLLAGHLALGAVLTHRGELVAARHHLDTALELCDAGNAVAHLVPETAPVFARVFSALNWWSIGDDSRAEEAASEALALGRREGLHTYAMNSACWVAATIAALRRDAETALHRCDYALDVAAASGYRISAPYLAGIRAWAIATSGDVEAGADEILRHAATLSAANNRMHHPLFLVLHAEVCLAAGHVDAALASANTGISDVEASGERWLEAELHRLRGEALAGLDPTDPAATAELELAVTIATAQGALELQRRAEASLARWASR
jgi:DNA-binding SARP family transcriptional activator